MNPQYDTRPNPLESAFAAFASGVGGVQGRKAASQEQLAKALPAFAQTGMVKPPVAQPGPNTIGVGGYNFPLQQAQLNTESAYSLEGARQRKIANDLATGVKTWDDYPGALNQQLSKDIGGFIFSKAGKLLMDQLLEKEGPGAQLKYIREQAQNLRVGIYGAKAESGNDRYTKVYDSPPEIDEQTEKLQYDSVTKKYRIVSLK
jgi:hypothetical protein